MVLWTPSLAFATPSTHQNGASMEAKDPRVTLLIFGVGASSAIDALLGAPPTLFSPATTVLSLTDDTFSASHVARLTLAAAARADGQAFETSADAPAAQAGGGPARSRKRGVAGKGGAG